jgi:hypothetical protein
MELMKRPIVTARRIVRQFIARKMKKGPIAGLKLHILNTIKNILELLNDHDREEKRMVAHQYIRMKKTILDTTATGISTLYRQR